MTFIDRYARTVAIAAGAVLATTLVLSGPAEARRVHRSLFYSGTPFGSLAWVQNAPTRSTARTRLLVRDLTGETCIALPPTGSQWFMINHRDEELEGQTGYFAIRILYRFTADSQSLDTRTGVHLQRNGNWFEHDGNTLAGEYERDSAQIPLSPAEFTELHDVSGSRAEENFAKLKSAVGNWHLKPTVEAENSWSDRYLYGAMLKAYFDSWTAAISARLLRFTVTSSDSSSQPVLFWLDPRGASSAIIRIDAPTLRYDGSRRVYEVFFDRECADE